MLIVAGWVKVEASVRVDYVAGCAEAVRQSAQIRAAEVARYEISSVGPP